MPWVPPGIASVARMSAERDIREGRSRIALSRMRDTRAHLPQRLRIITRSCGST
jgi:hypothetical protein